MIGVCTENRVNEYDDPVPNSRVGIGRQAQMCFCCLLFQGALVEAVRCGHWILLDEINLATPETLQCLSSLLEGPQESFIIPEKP